MLISVLNNIQKPEAVTALTLQTSQVKEHVMQKRTASSDKSAVNLPDNQLTVVSPWNCCVSFQTSAVRHVISIIHLSCYTQRSTAAVYQIQACHNK